MDILKQSYTKYALFMCTLLIICLLIMEVTGQSLTGKSPLYPMAMFIGSFILWFLAIREKKNQLGGKLSYKQGLNEGLKVSLAFSIISPFVFLLYYLFVNAELIEYAKSAYNMQEQSNAVVIAVDMIIQFISSFILGALYSGIIPLFLKTKS